MWLELLACSKIMTTWSKNCDDMRTEMHSMRTNGLSSNDPSRKVITRSLYFEVNAALVLLVV